MGSRTCRREVLSGGALALAGIFAGCSRRTYANSTPSFLGVRVGNSTDDEITAQITVSNDQSELVWQETFDLRPHADVRRNTDLHGKTYTVSVVLNPVDEANREEYRQEWQWQACDEDYIMVQISESDVDVSNECYDD